MTAKTYESRAQAAERTAVSGDPSTSDRSGEAPRLPLRTPRPSWEVAEPTWMRRPPASGVTLKLNSNESKRGRG